ncbi:hypothetical protein D3C84_893510 [compost metagenome]
MPAMTPPLLSMLSWARSTSSWLPAAVSLPAMFSSLEVSMRMRWAKVVPPLKSVVCPERLSAPLLAMVPPAPCRSPA